MAIETNLNTHSPTDRRMNDLGEQLDAYWRNPSARRRRSWPKAAPAFAVIRLPLPSSAVETTIPLVRPQASIIAGVERVVRIESLRNSTGAAVHSVHVPTGDGTYLTVRIDTTRQGASVTLLAPDRWLPILTQAVPALVDRCRRCAPRLRDIRCAPMSDPEGSGRPEHHR